ncbi:hypothetical protein BDA96_04G116600 [Sorghum bicolor]|uniref:Uncharacterized protein n=1 Tax=Sorghum bicolor TaxID=4558 RepID=A0A921R3P5_SORBI|nr:hypothetical protein BDA96_04G116600 [Sorghum bicolor]
MVSIGIDADRVRRRRPTSPAISLVHAASASPALPLFPRAASASPARSPASSSRPSTKFQDPTFSEPNPSQIDMNPPRPPSSSSRQARQSEVGVLRPPSLPDLLRSMALASPLPMDLVRPRFQVFEPPDFLLGGQVLRQAPMKGFTHQVVLPI